MRSLSRSTLIPVSPPPETCLGRAVCASAICCCSRAVCFWICCTVSVTCSSWRSSWVAIIGFCGFCAAKCCCSNCCCWISCLCVSWNWRSWWSMTRRFGVSCWLSSCGDMSPACTAMRSCCTVCCIRCCCIDCAVIWPRIAWPCGAPIPATPPPRPICCCCAN